MPRRDADLLVLEVSAEVAGHVCVAVQQHVKSCRRMGLALPGELSEIERALANRARRGQSGTPLEDLWQVRDAQQMTPRLLTFAETAQVLGISERTVKRLVAAQELASVRVLGAARIPLVVLEAYLERLVTESTSTP